VRHLSLQQLVKLAIVAAVGASILITLAMSGAYIVIDRAQSRLIFARELGTNISRLALLTTEFLVHQSPRVVTQWRRQHEILTDQVRAMPPYEGRKAIMADEIRSRLDAIAPIGERIGKALQSGGGRTQAEDDMLNTLSSSIISQSNALLATSREFFKLMADSAAHTQGYALLSAGGLFVLLTTAGGIYLLMLCTTMIGQILELRSTIGKLSKGDLEAEIENDSSNEIGDVFRDLDRMRRKMLISMNELGRANLQLITTKTELEDRTASLEAANCELEAFTSAVSHDLRAPLRSISGFTQAVLEDHGDQIDDEGRVLLARVTRSTRQMYQLIDDLLRLSKMPLTQIEMCKVNLSEMVQVICDTVRERDPERDVKVIIEPDAMAECDPRCIKIALTNLLENAWKFTSKSEKPEIEFGQTTTDGARTFFVRDTGAGFDMAYKDNLFKPFKRLHSASDYNGNGVGLATVHRILGLHGGKVWAEAQPGRGATFYFQLGSADRDTIGDARDVLARKQAVEDNETGDERNVAARGF